MVRSSESPPPPKKRRLDAPQPDQQQASQRVTLNDRDNTNITKPTFQAESGSRRLRVSPHGAILPLASEESKSRFSGENVHIEIATEKPKQPATARRPISPPPAKTNKKANAGPSDLNLHNTPAKVIKVEKLMPRSVSKDPVPYPQRLNILQKLHKQISDANDRIANTGDGNGFRLTAQQLIVQTLNEEQSAANANSSADGYKNAIAGRITYYKKISLSQWQEMVDQKWRQPQENPLTQKDTNSTKLVVTGLPPSLELAVLNNLSVSPIGLELYGYVSSQPPQEKIQQYKSSIISSANWESCDRCGTRFQVFPGRNLEGQLTTRGKCTYHWARPRRTKGGVDASYPCCSGSGGSEGCTEASTHVFKATDTARLASLLQFENTPEAEAGEQRHSALTFDCEMVYTTYGMELVRLTAVAFPSNKSLLDILVRPFGEVLDFNTRFSGINADHFRHAVEHGSNSVPDEGVSEDRELQDEPMRRVESPAEARKMLLDLITPRTFLIGHAIENDLNACRIIHPCIVDTALLFPHPKGLPIKFRLRDLAAKYLNRTIQAGGEEGHDSKEDSIATADLVKVKIKEKWQSMRLSGWKWDNGQLLGPSSHL